MRLSLLLIAACGAPAARPPIAAPCSADRIGAVTVTGAARADVPALAVLEGTFDDPARTTRIALAASAALHARGYARVAITVARSRGCFTELHVRVARGPRYRIARIAFATDDTFPAARRLAAIEDELGAVNAVGGVLVAYRLERALAALAKQYRDAGWLDAEIGRAQATYQADGSALTIPVRAGARYRVGVVRALGGSAAVRQRVLAALGVAPGAYYDGAAIRRALDHARLARRVQLRASTRDDRAEIELEAIVEATR